MASTYISRVADASESFIKATTVTFNLNLGERLEEMTYHFLLGWTSCCGEQTEATASRGAGGVVVRDVILIALIYKFK